MKTYDVRSAIKADAAKLAALEQEAFSTDRISLRNWRRLIKSASATVFVAVCEERVVGSAVILTRKNSTIARLYSIAVSTAFRRAGAGRTLITFACLLAFKQRCREIRLESRANNFQAHELFRSLGFRTWGRQIDGYYADGMAARRFRFELPTDTAARADLRSHEIDRKPKSQFAKVESL